MIKKIKSEILMGYYDQYGNYTCTWTQVVDQAATNAAIAECEAGWQAEIDECKSQIDQYNQLKTDIGNKKNEATALKSEFGSNTSLLNSANVTHKDTDLGPCSDCLDNLMQTYDDMCSQCDSEIADWGAKMSNAESKKGSCPADTPKVYKDVCI